MLDGAQDLALQLSNIADPGAGPSRLYGKHCVMFRIEGKKGQEEKKESEKKRDERDHFFHARC